MAEYLNPKGISVAMRPNWFSVYHSLVWMLPLLSMAKTRGESLYLARMMALVRQWHECHGEAPNPLPTARNPGDYSWLDMSTAYRADVLAALYAALPQEDSEALLLLETLLAHHLAVLKSDAYYARIGNHALHQNNALLLLSLLYDDEEGIALAQGRMDTLVRESVDDEGVSLEGAPGYHILNLNWWEKTRKRWALAKEIRPELNSPFLPDMRPLLAYAVAPDADLVPIGDTPLDANSTLIRYRDKFGARFIQELCANPEVDFALSGGRQGRQPDGTQKVFKDGYVFSRIPFGDDRSRDSHCSLRFGPGLSARVHAHDDGGSVTYYPRGARLLEDGGMYGYYGGEYREFIKSPFAHNVVCADGMKYYRSAVNLLNAASSDPCGDFAQVEIKAIAQARWTRRLVHGRAFEFLLVEDVFDNASRGMYQNWNLGDGFGIVNLRKNRVDVTNGMLNASFFWLCELSGLEVLTGSKNPLRGWRSGREGEIHPVSSLRASLAGERVKIPVLILPLPSNADFDDLAVSEITLRSRSIRFSVTWADTRKNLVIDCFRAENP